MFHACPLVIKFFIEREKTGKINLWAGLTQGLPWLILGMFSCPIPQLNYFFWDQPFRVFLLELDYQA
jgi:uncharacterized membrane protein YagU involved in acid resistance